MSMAVSDYISSIVELIKMVTCSCSSTFSLADTYSDEFGRLDFDRSQLGSGMSNRSKVKRFVTALNRLAERTNKRMFEFQELRQLAKDLQIQVNIIYISGSQSRGRDPLGGRETVRGGRAIFSRNQNLFLSIRNNIFYP